MEGNESLKGFPTELIDRLDEARTRCGWDLDHNASTPCWSEVTFIVHALRAILFPGYWRGRWISTDRPVLVAEVCDRLTVEVARCLDRGKRRDAHEVAVSLLVKIPEIYELLMEDARAAFEGDPAAVSVEEVVACYPGHAALTVFRVAHELYLLGVPILPRMMTELVHGETGIDIHPGASIGRRFFIDHGTGVVIGETTVIGDSVTIYQGVTLGALNFQKDETGCIVRGAKRHPTLEGSVVVYANATILGGSTVVGEHAVIGSSARVLRSVEPWAVVLADGCRCGSRPPTVEQPPAARRAALQPSRT